MAVKATGNRKQKKPAARRARAEVPKLSPALAQAKREGWLKRVRCERDERAVRLGCTFNEPAAKHVVEFFKKFLRHSKGRWAGQAFDLFPWQEQEIIYPLFGWMREDGSRRYRKAGVWIPKKNGKSTMCSAIGLYMLVGDGEPGAEVYTVGVDRDQAGIVHREAINMVDSSPALAKALKVNRATHNIHYAKTMSWYRALTADGDSNQGKNAHCIIKDELHAWRDRDNYSSLKWAFAARSQPLDFTISTAGDDLNSIGREQYDYAKAILENLNTDIDADEFLPFIREADEKADDLDDPETWKRANPSMPEVIKLDSFAAEWSEAKKSASARAQFMRYRFNIWATATNPAIKLDDWQACRKSYTEHDLLGQPCVAALDMAAVADMSALVLLFPDGDEATGDAAQPEADGGESVQAGPNPVVDVQIVQAMQMRMKLRSLCWFWMPQATVWDIRNPNAQLYQGWSKSGLLYETDGNEVAHEEILLAMVKIFKRFDVRALVYDPMFATGMAQHIETHHAIPRIEFPQTATQYAAPTVAFERAIIGHRFGHNGHPIMGWHAGNLAFHTNRMTGWKRPVKPEDGNHRKIDSMAAGIMGFAGLLNPAILQPVRSVYETRGIQCV